MACSFDVHRGRAAQWTLRHPSRDLERHAGLWETGARWSSRMDARAEKVNAGLEAKDREIAELRERLQRWERRSA
jgi:hypothetical protein